MQTTKEIFYEEFEKLCNLYGKKCEQKQALEYWKVIGQKGWSLEKFNKIVDILKETEATFPSLVKWSMAGRDIPDSKLTHEEAKNLWDNMPECGNCSDGVVYLVAREGEGRFMASCSACEKGRFRARKSASWTPIHPVSLKTPEGRDFSLTHKRDLIPHAKWENLDITGVKYLLSILPKSGGLKSQYLVNLRKMRPDLFSLLLVEEGTANAHISQPDQS